MLTPISLYKHMLWYVAKNSEDDQLISAAPESVRSDCSSLHIKLPPGWYYSKKHARLFGDKNLFSAQANLYLIKMWTKLYSHTQAWVSDINHLVFYDPFNRSRDLIEEESDDLESILCENNDFVYVYLVKTLGLSLRYRCQPWIDDVFMACKNVQENDQDLSSYIALKDLSKIQPAFIDNMYELVYLRK